MWRWVELNWRGVMKNPEMFDDIKTLVHRLQKFEVWDAWVDTAGRISWVGPMDMGEDSEEECEDG